MIHATLVACTLGSMGGAASAGSRGTGEVSFSEHIAPIVHAKCAGCHRPGQVGPFPLLTYEDVNRRAETIQRVIEAGYMPPWKAAGEFEFAHDRRLTSQEARLWAAWFDGGRPQGDPARMPAAPRFRDTWTLGKPDLVVQMRAPFSISADGPDIYRSFVFPLDLPKDVWVKAVELRPTARPAVHHALFFLDDSGTARRLDGADGQPGIGGMGFRITGGLGGYVPGATPTFLPGDLALPLPKGSDVVMQTHFHPSGTSQTEQATLALYFTDQPPSRRLVPIQIPPLFGRGMGIDIPAGERNYTIRDRFTIPVDVEAVNVGGHAHYVCRAMTLTATLPGGTVKTLLAIEDWDLDWQDRYTFREFVKLPAGTVIEATIVYDNSADNPRNPFDPPRRIRWGRQSTDEMGSMTLLVVPADERDAQRLQLAARGNLARMFGQVADDWRSRLGRAVPGPISPERILETLDENEDGLIQEAEVPPALREFFDRIDADASGALDSAELRAVAARLAALRNRP